MYKIITREEDLSGVGYELFKFTQWDWRWYFNGAHHREGKPAKVFLYPWTKQVQKLVWHRHGYLHNENGPAAIDYNDTGIIKQKNWFVNDCPLTKWNFKSISMVNKMKAWELFTPVELVRLRSV